MQFTVRSTVAIDGGEEVTADSDRRDVVVDLEKLTPNATRLSITVRSGAFPYDSATSAEILRQIERAMPFVENPQGAASP